MLIRRELPAVSFLARRTLKTGRMKREISLYLDLLRFLAALVVLLQHLSWAHFSGGLLWQIGPYGAQAVIVFFVLSGYVIGYVTDRADNTPRRYAVDRAAPLSGWDLPEPSRNCCVCLRPLSGGQAAPAADRGCN